MADPVYRYNSNTAQSLLQLSSSDPETGVKGRVRWSGDWSSNRVNGYEVNDMVRDGIWTAISLIDLNFDRPAPQPIGSIEWILPDTPTWTNNQHTGTVYSGVQVTPPEDKIFLITAVRIWIPDVSATVSYRTVVYDIENETFSYGPTRTGDEYGTVGWHLSNIQGIFLEEGRNYIFLLEARSSATTTDFTYPWVWQGASNSNSNPGSGNMNRRNNPLFLRINPNDADAVDRTSDLIQIINGTTVRIAQDGTPANYLLYVTTQDIVDEGGYYTVTCSLSNQGGTPATGQRANVEYNIPIPQPTSYVSIIDEFAFASALQGYVAFDQIVGGANDNNAYGVDLQYQEYVVSDDWALIGMLDV